MTDRVYPSSKPNGKTATAATTPAAANPPKFPAAKSQLYNTNRHPYRPTPTAAHRHDRRRGGRRSCLCCCCFWSILFLLVLLLLAAIAAAAAYALYRPQRPAFSVSSLRISQFNLTSAADDSTRLTTKFNLTISSKNPNKKIIFYYGPITITSLANQVQIANGSFPSFTSDPNNITIVHCPLGSSSQVLDADSVTSLRSDLRRKTGLPLEILLDTSVVVKMDRIKSEKVGIRVKCQGIHGSVPQRKSPPTVASTSKAKCKVDLRIKIWKWTF
ncbi:hypothetical protein RJ640_003680 [Escallonia rubra]|uniref:Late embryogenesis abundant protein LEA-2 subgroup domain-containing protein n=1 Tax=Escallonia rubra TaxID=112253 RepID=A0AA88QP51_9ASTE|nr:hypothetical protein RJ640_003680 [Escallonia rubra]